MKNNKMFSIILLSAVLIITGCQVENKEDSISTNEPLNLTISGTIPTDSTADGDAIIQEIPAEQEDYNKSFTFYTDNSSIESEIDEDDYFWQMLKEALNDGKNSETDETNNAISYQECLDGVAMAIDDVIDAFLTVADTRGYGAKMSSQYKSLVSGTVCEGIWKITISDLSALKNNNDFHWSSNPKTHKPGDDKTNINDASELLTIELADKFPDVKNCCFEASVSFCCQAVWYTDMTNDSSKAEMFANGNMLIDGIFPDHIDWVDSIPGKIDDNLLIGTYPKID